MLQLSLSPHALLRAAAFTTRLPAPLAECAPTPALRAGLALAADVPLRREEEVRAAVRDLLRHGGYKPTGRGKPASEYLARAAGEGTLDSINLAVDACNVTSLHSGLPISVVDLELTQVPLRVAIQPEGTRYVFNPSGQEIDVSGLLCLEDAQGPFANAVKDSQRTKTHAGTRSTLSFVWGVAGHEERLAAATAWYRELLAGAGAETEDVELLPG